MYHITPVPFNFKDSIGVPITPATTAPAIDTTAVKSIVQQIPTPTTKEEITHKTLKFAMYMIHVTIILNLFVATDFHLFPRRTPYSAMTDYFHYGNLLHNYTLAYMTAIYLEGMQLRMCVCVCVCVCVFVISSS